MQTYLEGQDGHDCHLGKPRMAELGAQHGTGSNNFTLQVVTVVPMDMRYQPGKLTSVVIIPNLPLHYCQAYRPITKTYRSPPCVQPWAKCRMVSKCYYEW